MQKFTVEFTFHDLLDDVMANNEDEAKEIARDRLEHSGARLRSSSPSPTSKTFPDRRG